MCCFWKVLKNGIRDPIWWWNGEAPPTKGRQEDGSRRLSGQVVPPLSTAEWMALAYVGTTSVLTQTSFL